MAVASGFFIYTIRTMDRPRAAATGYMDDVIRAGVIATAFWGIAGFTAGVYIAFELAFPELNWGLSYTNFAYPGLDLAICPVTESTGARQTSANRHLHRLQHRRPRRRCCASGLPGFPQHHH